MRRVASEEAASEADEAVVEEAVSSESLGNPVSPVSPASRRNRRHHVFMGYQEEVRISSYILEETSFIGM